MVVSVINAVLSFDYFKRKPQVILELSNSREAVESEFEGIKTALEKGKPITAEIKAVKPRRSLDANSYFHVLVGKIAEASNSGFEETKTKLVLEYGTEDRDGEGYKVGVKLPISADVTKYYRYAKWFDTREEDGRKFHCYIFFKQTHLMDSAEMTRLIDGTVYEAKNLGIETMTPAELARMKGEWKNG